MHRILFVLSNTNLGGAEKQAIQLAKGLRKSFDYDIRFLCIGSEEGSATKLLRESLIDYEYFQVYDERSKIKTIQGLLKLVFFIRKTKPFMLLPYVSLANYYCTTIWRFSGVKYCIWNQRDEGLGLPNGILSRIIIKNASYYITNSLVSSKMLTERYGVDFNKVNLIYNGICIQKPVLTKSAWRKKFGFKDQDILIGMIANITKYKDHITLVKAWQLILENCLELKDIKLVLAGRKDDKYDEVNDMVSKLPDPSSVVFMDFIDDINSMVNAIDLSVLTSISEGFSNSVIESMSGGLVVLGYNIHGISEPLSDENKLYLTEPGNEEQLYQSISKMLYQDELRNRIGESNRLRVLGNFQMNHTVEKTHELLNRIANCKTV